MQLGPDEAERLAMGGMMQAVVSHLHEPFGQDVLEEAGQEVHDRQRYFAGPAGVRFTVTERDGFVIVVKDVAEEQRGHVSRFGN